MKPVLLAMCNPRSSNPTHALWPDPPGCSGHRLWQLLRDQLPGVMPEDYCRAFDRRNLLPTRYWADAAARRAVPKIVAELVGREVLVLGSSVRDAIRLPPILVHPQEVYGVVWRQLPHPSGRCLWYNDSGNRTMAGILLKSLYERSRP